MKFSKLLTTKRIRISKNRLKHVAIIFATNATKMDILLIAAALLDPVLKVETELQRVEIVLEAVAEVEAMAGVAEANSVVAAAAVHLFAQIAKLGDLFLDLGLKVDPGELLIMSEL